ncbi:unnamed protein product [Cuscuta campestris]|uniref:RNase H type-1 domain-containing protein n=1 Tax=Cuscuta campestris TaxID=132261 RepID=A0A484KX96_9ASTE|nr:unnamed protein product [Cuscuta campestris]
MAIANIFGKTIKLDSTTENFSRTSVARFCVEMNLSSLPQNSFYVKNGDTPLLLQAEFENLHDFCKICKGINRHSASCKHFSPPMAKIPMPNSNQTSSPSQQSHHSDTSSKKLQTNPSKQLPPKKPTVPTPSTKPQANRPVSTNNNNRTNTTSTPNSTALSVPTSHVPSSDNLSPIPVSTSHTQSPIHEPSNQTSNHNQPTPPSVPPFAQSPTPIQIPAQPPSNQSLSLIPNPLPNTPPSLPADQELFENNFQEEIFNNLFPIFAQDSLILESSSSYTQLGHLLFTSKALQTKLHISTIYDNWEPYRGGGMRGLMDKLVNLRKVIQAWNKSTFGNILKNRTKMEDILKLAEEAYNDNPTHDSNTRMQQARSDLNNCLAIEYSYWKQKSNLKWVKEGDLNTKFFQAFVKNKRNFQRIQKIKNTDNNWLTEWDDIASEATSFSNTLFRHEEADLCPEILDNIPLTLNHNDNLFLCSLPTMEEVKTAIWDLCPDSSPGPDGFIGHFFREKKTKKLFSEISKLLSKKLTLQSNLRKRKQNLTKKQIPKISFFQWRLHQKLLPFPAHLRKFGITSLPSICHLCKRDSATTRLSQATHGVRAYLHKWWTEYHNQTLEGWLKGIIPGIISHQIWKERNRRIHENSSKESGRLLQDCIAQVQEWVLGRAPSKLKYFDAWRLPPELMLSQQRNPSLRVHRWTNTSDNGLHLSTDVAINQNYGVASAVLRRGNGTFIAAGTWKIEETSALQGEAKALAIGIQWAAHFGRYIWANTDCKSLAKSISSRKNPGVNHELWTTLLHAFSHSGQKISYIPREGNMGAHHLAKWAIQHNLFTPCISFLIAPPHVQGAITADVMLPFFR